MDIGPEQLTEHWRQVYGSSLLAHSLRMTLADRWSRIHTLPGSKRYPETADEYAIILHRHNQVLSFLFSSQPRLCLITTDCSFDRNSLRDAAASDSWYWTTARGPDSDDPDAAYWHLYVTEMQWQRGKLDGLLRLVAEDKLANVMILGISQRVLYHPYDGGGDAILPDRQARDRFRLAFADWLPARPNGL